MQINPAQSLRRSRLVRRLGLQLVFDYILYACLLVGLGLMTGMLAVGLHGSHVHQAVVVGLLLLLSGGTTLWVAHGLWRLHQLTRLEHRQSKSQLKETLQHLFPGWRHEELSSAVWRLHKPGGGRRQHLYVLLASGAVYLNLVSLGQGDWPSPFHAAANYRRLQRLQPAFGRAQPAAAR